MKTKEVYQTPKIEIIALENQNEIMNSSITYDKEATTDGIARGKKKSFWENDER